MLDNAGNQPGEAFASLGGDGENLLDLDRLQGIGQADVGDNRQGQYPQSGMSSDYHLGNRRHSHDVGPHGPQHAILGPGFKIRAGHPHEDPLLSRDSQLERTALGQRNQLAVIRFGHVGEAGPEAVIVSTPQRVVAHQVDVIFNDHDVGELELVVHAARGIGQQQNLDPQCLHHADREGHLLHGVTFIEMEASLHRHDVEPLQAPADQLPGVRFDSRFGKVRDLAIGDHRRLIDL